MKTPLACLVVFLLTAVSFACKSQEPYSTPQPDTAQCVELPETDFQGQWMQNHLAWEEHGRGIAAESPGSWVLIAGGEVLGTWADFEDAWQEANKLPSEKVHAYLYRAGVDDQPVTFMLSPFRSDQPHWIQLGVRVRRPWGVTISAVNNSWTRAGRSVAWGDLEARLYIENPDTSKQREVRAVASNLFQEDLTLRRSDVRALGLGRFTAPLPAYYLSEENPCEKVVLTFRIPELDIDVPAVAYVLPE